MLRRAIILKPGERYCAKRFKNVLPFLAMGGALAGRLSLNANWEHHAKIFIIKRSCRAVV